MSVLYVVATPIGNREDITHRALRILQTVERIVAEDTRTSRKLLSHWQITTPLQSMNARQEKDRITSLLRQLKNSQAGMALISDAGTPLISDPGVRFVDAALRAGIKVIPIPGAAALTTALSVAGLPTDHFWFEGFLPHKKGRNKRLAILAEMPGTIVLYESPYRIEKTLQQLVEYVGADRHCVIAREMTKLYEEFRRGELASLARQYAEEKARGEFVILVAPADFKWNSDDEAKPAN
jgi:16S rRNA (cytidine1402-2'-O)-methyltransferase